MLGFATKPVVVVAEQFFAAEKPLPEGVYGINWLHGGLASGYAYNTNTNPAAFRVSNLHPDSLHRVPKEGMWVVTYPDETRRIFTEEELREELDFVCELPGERGETAA